MTAKRYNLFDLLDLTDDAFMMIVRCKPINRAMPFVLVATQRTYNATERAAGVMLACTLFALALSLAWLAPLYSPSLQSRRKAQPKPNPEPAPYGWGSVDLPLLVHGADAPDLAAQAEVCEPVPVEQEPVWVAEPVAPVVLPHTLDGYPMPLHAISLPMVAQPASLPIVPAPAPVPMPSAARSKPRKPAKRRPARMAAMAQEPTATPERPATKETAPALPQYTYKRPNAGAKGGYRPVTDKDPADAPRFVRDGRKYRPLS